MGILPLLGAIIAAAPVLSATTLAQSTDEKFNFQLIGHFSQVNSNVQIGVPGTSVGTEIDLEDTLSLDRNKTLPALAASVRLGGNWRTGLEFYRLSRDGSRTNSTAITIDDVTYPISATVKGELASDVYRLTVGYSLIRNEQAEFGLALGAHVTDFRFSIEGNGVVGSQSAAFHARRRKILAPLPTVGVYGSYQIAPQVTIAGRADYLSLKVDDYKGNLVNAQASLSYRFTEHFGIGAMYRLVRYRLAVDRDDWAGKVGYRFKGPAIFLEAGF